MSKRAVVTGSSGLIGSEAVLQLDSMGWEVHGIDDNSRKAFFGEQGDTSWNLEVVRARATAYVHHDCNITDRRAIPEIFQQVRPELILHCAAQPSHDLAATIPFQDFDTNAGGTLNLLEATRAYCPEASFVFMSTNKVYGDAPNEVPLVEKETRFDFADPEFEGIAEDFRIDSSLHSLFGASKLAADIMVQEYGRYFGIPTVCFRAGCLTGSQHSAAELHGFLAYLAQVAKAGRTYRIFGYSGKQVRDNLHAADMVGAFLAFHAKPQVGAVYNMGGGRGNSVSVLEAVERFEHALGTSVAVEYVDEARKGDHICYISDLSKMRHDYPDWSITRDLDDIFEELSSKQLTGTA